MPDHKKKKKASTTPKKSALVQTAADGGGSMYVRKDGARGKQVEKARKLMKMKKAGIKYEMISYEDANHGYTNPDAEALKERFKGMRLEYNEEAGKETASKRRTAYQKVLQPNKG